LRHSLTGDQGTRAQAELNDEFATIAHEIFLEVMKKVEVIRPAPLDNGQMSIF
jgi:hypothetical protein